MREEHDLEVVRVSPVYETSPWGVNDQSDYLNAVIQLTTTMAPGELLSLTQKIERQAGRQPRMERWTERELDIDILIFGDLQVSKSDLTLPHPRLILRRFVLQPLSDIAGGLIIPGLGLSVDAALARCQDEGEVKLFHKALQL